MKITPSARQWIRSLALALSLVAGFVWPLSGPAHYHEPARAASGAAPDLAGPIGLVSDALPCLAINSGAPAGPIGTLQFAWSGEAQSARLALDVSGTHGAQPVWVN